MKKIFFVCLFISALSALNAQENDTLATPPKPSEPPQAEPQQWQAPKEEEDDSDLFSYFAFKINYGLRPVSRAKSFITIGIDSSDNQFQTTIIDSFDVSYINDLKGFSFGFEAGFDNHLFTDWMLDIVSRTRGKHNTSMISVEGNLGYNHKLIRKHAVFLRPSLGVSYSHLSTELGNYYSNYYYYGDIEVKQNTTLFSLRPRLQVEIPVRKFKDVGALCVRFEAGYSMSAYFSRFIKLRAQRTEPNSRGNYEYDADRFYLDGRNSGYTINGKHVNVPPAKMGGPFLGVEIAFKFSE